MYQHDSSQEQEALYRNSLITFKDTDIQVEVYIQNIKVIVRQHKSKGNINFMIAIAFGGGFEKKFSGLGLISNVLFFILKISKITTE